VKKIGPPRRSNRHGAHAPEVELVLYVEDEDQNWITAELRLKRSYHLVRARNDREACEMLARYGDQLSAILIDIQLHGSVLDGIQLARLIRGKPVQAVLPAYAEAVPVMANVPILFVTANGARYSEPVLLSAGGNKLITKPVNFVQLTSALAQLQLQRVIGCRKPPAE
jgi:CheY-like chemotaxis protein